MTNEKMTEKHFRALEFDEENCVIIEENAQSMCTVSELVERLNQLYEEDEKLKSLIQSLRNELKFDEKQYKVFLEVIEEADDLIKSHLSTYYNRKWRNFCENMGVEL